MQNRKMFKWENDTEPILQLVFNQVSQANQVSEGSEEMCGFDVNILTGKQMTKCFYSYSIAIDI